MIKCFRWQVVALAIMVLMGMAKANAQGGKGVSDLSPQEQPQASPQNQVQIQEETSEGETPNPILDTRDRIFYPGDTERPKPLLRKLFLNIVLDQKEIFTSPFHANRHNALEWLVPLGVTGALIASDTHIANAFENSSGQVRWGGRISDIGASYTLIPIVAGSYVYGAWRDNPKAREIGVLGTERSRECGAADALRSSLSSDFRIESPERVSAVLRRTSRSLSPRRFRRSTAIALQRCRQLGRWRRQVPSCRIPEVPR